MLDYIIPASGLLFTLQNIIWINLGVFIGAVFACIPGLSVILCVILFLPLTYQLTAIPGMMFLLGIYCAGSYGGSVSAILINTPGTPHAAATMLDGHPLSKKGRSRVALKIALYASTIGGTISAFMLLFLGPQVAKVAAQLGTAEYFMVCVFGLTIIAGVSGKSIIKGIISACIGLVISCIGSDPMTGYDRLTFNVDRLYLGLDLAICLIGLFALIEIIAKADGIVQELKMDERKKLDDGVITPDEKKRMVRPILMSSFIGCMVGIIPGTGAAEASWFSYNQAKNMSKHKEEFGHGSVEGIAAAESANNAVTGATLIPLLTLGIPGDGTVAIMLSALMINGLNPGLSLFTTDGDIMYAIMLGLILVNIFMLIQGGTVAIMLSALMINGLNPGLSLFTTDGDIMYAIMLGLILVNIFMLIQGKYLTRVFAKVVAVPQEILTPIIVLFCYAGAYSINKNYFDVSIALYFGIAAWFLRKLDLPAIPILLGLVLGDMTETNFRRALMLSDGNPSIFFSSVYCWIFIALIVLALGAIIKGKIKEERTLRELKKQHEAEEAALAAAEATTTAAKEEK